ncbi:MAG TPA: alpha/beta fold hydrolase, partial [Lysobacter sp.]
MIWTDVGVGRAAAAERDVVIRPKYVRAPSRGVLYAHGSEAGEGGAVQWMSIPSRWPVMRAVGAKATMVAADLGGNQTWGNNTAIARMASAYTYARALPDFADTKVNILAQSMGATTALAWAAQNPTLVGRIALMIPVINLADLRDNSWVQPNIDAAYGGTYVEATQGATHNPLTLAAAGKFAGLQIQLWYGTTDTLCKPEHAEQFATYVPGCQLKPIPGGHAESTILEIDPDEL